MECRPVYIESRVFVVNDVVKCSFKYEVHLNLTLTRTSEILIATVDCKISVNIRKSGRKA